jgi:predicted phage terminase large subunit-like protein
MKRAMATIDLHIGRGEDVPPHLLSESIQYVQYLRQARSVTFVPAKVYDNPALLRTNPDYLANLKSLSRVERARLLDGNWKVRATAGSYFAKSDARIVPEVPDDVVRWLRSWDLAATEPNELNRDPDWTVGMKLGRRKNGRVIVADVKRIRRNAATVRELVMATALEDGNQCWIQLPQDPGQAGKDQSDSYHDLLRGYPLFSRTITRNKTALAEPAAAAWQRGSIELVVAPWNDEVLSELDRFPSPNTHDDCVDALSGGYNLLPSADVPNYQDSGISRKFRDRPT